MKRQKSDKPGCVEVVDNEQAVHLSTRLDREQLDLELEGSVGWDHRREAPGAICLIKVQGAADDRQEHP